jgi:hypothetical protein
MSQSPPQYRFPFAAKYDLLVSDQPEPLTDAYLLEVAARCKAAQVGPWRVDRGKEVGDNWIVATGAGYHDNDCWAVATDSIHASDANAADGQDDATFIAHARQDVPRLLEEIARLRAIVARDWQR